MFLKISMILVIFCEACASLKILGVFPHFAKSHFAMTGSLMRQLAQRGYQVDVISRFPQQKLIPNYTDIILVSNSSAANLTYAELGKFGGVSVKFMVERCGVRVCELLGQPDVQQVLRTRRGYYDVIVVELFVAHCYLATGRHLNAPMVGIVTSKLHDWLYEPFGNPLNPSYVPSYFSALSQRMTFWQRLRNTFLTSYAANAMDYLLEAQVQQVDRHFGRKLSSMRELYDDISLVLVNAHHSLNDIKPTTPDIVEVGGLHVVDDDQQLTPELQKWLDESTNGCVLFTFGSMMQIESYPKEVINIFYKMFERIAPVRFLVKIANVSAFPVGLPGNVKTAPWLPQVAVLKHKNVKVFITHGGLMGTQEAVAYKVPMVGLPIFGDQHTNIQSYVEKKIAVALSFETLTADLLTNAVINVLTDPTFRNNIENISARFWDRPVSAMDSAVYWVEYTARHGKILRSPATELTWWQVYLLDIYGFLVLCALIVGKIVKKILGLICFRRRRQNFKYSITSTTELTWWQYYLFYIYGSTLSSVFIMVFICRKIIDLIFMWKNSMRKFLLLKKNR